MSEYKRLTERIVRNLKGNNYPQDYYDIYNRLAELEDKIDDGDLVFVPKCEPKYELYGNDVLGWAINKYAYEPLFEKAWYTIAVFTTKAEAEKYLEELKK